MTARGISILPWPHKHSACCILTDRPRRTLTLSSSHYAVGTERGSSSVNNAGNGTAQKINCWLAQCTPLKWKGCRSIVSNAITVASSQFTSRLTINARTARELALLGAGFVQCSTLTGSQYLGSFWYQLDVTLIRYWEAHFIRSRNQVQSIGGYNSSVLMRQVNAVISWTRSEGLEPDKVWTDFTLCFRCIITPPDNRKLWSICRTILPLRLATVTDPAAVLASRCKS